LSQQGLLDGTDDGALEGAIDGLDDGVDDGSLDGLDDDADDLAMRRTKAMMTKHSRDSSIKLMTEITTEYSMDLSYRGHWMTARRRSTGG
jgi:hypothetical protein